MKILFWFNVSTAVVARCIVAHDIHTTPAYILWQYCILDKDVSSPAVIAGLLHAIFGALALPELREKDSVVGRAVLVCDFQQAQATSWLFFLSLSYKPWTACAGCMQLYPHPNGSCTAQDTLQQDQATVSIPQNETGGDVLCRAMHAGECAAGGWLHRAAHAERDARPLAAAPV